MAQGVFCFRCAGFREAAGSVQRDWGFGPRWFCKEHAYLAAELTNEVHGVAEPARQVITSPDEPNRAQAAPKQVRPGKPKQGVSLAAWCREAAKTMTFDQVVEGLVKAFPESKPGQNPKLAKGYVTCYLKRGAA